MRAFVVTLALLAAPTAFAQGQPTYGCDTPESKRLDFWVGDWELTYTGPGGKPAKSRNRITKTLDGCVVLEEFTGAPGTKLDGRSYSTYDPGCGNHRRTTRPGPPNGRLRTAG